MSTEDQRSYDRIREGGAAFYEQDRGLIAVWGNEAVQFLDGLMTNDVKTLGDGGQISAAFPNAQGRLLAVVRIVRQGNRFLFETEEATHEKVFKNLFRFTFAGDFFVEDLSDAYSYFEICGPKEDVFHPGVGDRYLGSLAYELPFGASYFIPNDLADEFRSFLSVENGCVKISDELYEMLRIENGAPRYGVDMDETTIVPELGIDGLISYNKGCYIGQEIIARIHFRGHVAKQLTGLILLSQPTVTNASPTVEDHGNASGTLAIQSPEGKNAGFVTSVTYSPKLGESIALAFVRYGHLALGTELRVGDTTAIVTQLPFVN